MAPRGFRRTAPARVGRQLTITIWLFTLPAMPATAQTQAGTAIAQELQRQIDRERALREQQEKIPDIRLMPPAITAPGRLPPGETPCLPIRDIVLRDASGAFDWALAAADPDDDPASGRCLGSAGIRTSYRTR